MAVYVDDLVIALKDPKAITGGCPDELPWLQAERHWSYGISSRHDFLPK